MCKKWQGIARYFAHRWRDQPPVPTEEDWPEGADLRRGGRRELQALQCLTEREVDPELEEALEWRGQAGTRAEGALPITSFTLFPYL